MWDCKPSQNSRTFLQHLCIVSQELHWPQLPAARRARSYGRYAFRRISDAFHHPILIAAGYFVGHGNPSES